MIREKGLKKLKSFEHLRRKRYSNFRKLYLQNRIERV